MSTYIASIWDKKILKRVLSFLPGRYLIICSVSKSWKEIYEGIFKKKELYYSVVVENLNVLDYFFRLDPEKILRSIFNRDDLETLKKIERTLPYPLFTKWDGRTECYKYLFKKTKSLAKDLGLEEKYKDTYKKKYKTECDRDYCPSSSDSDFYVSSDSD